MMSSVAVLLRKSWSLSKMEYNVLIYRCLNCVFLISEWTIIVYIKFNMNDVCGS